MKNLAVSVFSFLCLSLSSIYGEDGANIDMQKVLNPNLWKGIMSVDIVFEQNGPLKLNENSIRKKVELEFTKNKLLIHDSTKPEDSLTARITVRCSSTFIKNDSNENTKIAFNLELIAETGAETTAGGYGLVIIDRTGTTGFQKIDFKTDYLDPVIAGYADVMCEHYMDDNP